MNATAADGLDADDLSLCFFPTQVGKNKAITTEWELVSGDDEDPDNLPKFPVSTRFVQCDCACK